MVVKQRRLDRFQIRSFRTLTETDFMKSWCPSLSSRDKEQDAAFETDAIQFGEDVDDMPPDGTRSVGNAIVGMSTVCQRRCNV